MKTLKGWIINGYCGMSRVEFCLDNKDFSARMDEEIWDLSSYTEDYINFCNDEVYCSFEKEDGNVFYRDVVSLKEWVERGGYNYGE